MRILTLTTAITLFSIGGAICTADEPTPRFVQPARSYQVSVDGRVPVRLKRVVDGDFRPADRGTVTFVRNGQVAHQASVQAGGTVQAEGLDIGAYSVFVHGDSGFAAFSTWLASESDAAETADELLSVGLVPSGDLPIVRQIISDHKNISIQGIPVLGEETFDVAVRSSGPSRKLAHGAVLEISPDGTLRGRVLRNTDPDSPLAFAGASVYFVRANRIVSRTVTDSEGLFQVRDLATGIFSLVVAGEGSFSALSVQVVPAVATTAQGPVVNNMTLVSLQGELPVPEVTPVFPEDVIVVEEYWLIEDDPLATGGFPGGGGVGGGGMAAGGGGYAGGGLGLGELLVTGLVVGGIIAIAEDDDSTRIISPVNPGPTTSGGSGGGSVSSN